MNKKTLIIALCILLTSIIFALFSIFSVGFKRGSNLAGQLVFAHTSTQGAHLDKVVITTPQSTTTLQLQNGFWLVNEGNNYYANMALTNALFTGMNKSRYFTQIDTQGRELSEFFLNTPQTNNQNSGTLIQTYAQDKILDEVLIGGTTADNIYTFVRKPHDNDIWLINNDFTIPQKTYSWFQQPLLNYAPQQIKSFETQVNNQNIIYKRMRPADDFMSQEGKSETLRTLSEAFNYMTFNNVVKNTDFDITQYPNQHNLQITLFNGLVTTMDIYADNDLKNFWTSIKISANRLPTLGVNDYIKNNEFLYDGWIFQLSPEIGNILYKSFDMKK